MLHNSSHSNSIQCSQVNPGLRESGPDNYPMRPLGHALRGVALLGKPSVHQVVKVQEQRLGSLSLGSTTDRRVTDGVNARRPTGALELRRAEEVQKCADKGWKSALICLGNMRKGGVSPGSAAYNVALKVCAGAGEWGRAAALVEDMQGSGATPDAGLVVEITAATEGLRGGSSSSSVSPGGDATAAAATVFSEDGDLSFDSVSSGSSTTSSNSSNGGSSISSKFNSTSGRTRGSGSSSKGNSGSHGSIASMHTAAAASSADGEWPSPRSPNIDGNSGAPGGPGRRLLSSVEWSGRRWRNDQNNHDDDQHEIHFALMPQAGLWDNDGEIEGGGWKPVGTPAPFAGGWGDD